MKALTLAAYNDFKFGDAPEPECEAGDVVVNIRACGICGSDIHGMDGSSGRRIPPIIMGHEAAGEVDTVGAEVTDWKPGEIRKNWSSIEKARKVLGFEPQDSFDENIEKTIEWFIENYEGKQ